MAYQILTIICLIVAALSVLFALKTLFNRSWFLGWLRGSSGFLLLFLAATAAIVALDLSTYRQLVKEQPIASLSFQKKAPQEFIVTLVEPSGKEREYTVAGDLWQLDARVIKWSKPLAGVGLSPGYRLGRLSGRFYSLEQERGEERTIYELHEKDYGVDIWTWFNKNPQFAWVDAVFGSATFLPMSDGALFTVNMSGTGLIARPLNDAAQNAVLEWQ